MAQHDSATQCQNCKANIKTGLLSNNRLLSKLQQDIIREFTGGSAQSYCEKCGKPLVFKGVDEIRYERGQLNQRYSDLLGRIPVVTIHSPVGWDYDVLGIVTGQSATGTGVFSEFAQSFSDFFGEQSGTVNRKLRGGEDLCLSQVRINTLNLKGNAILATDVNYSELGGGRGIIMVCITGTAVRLRNLQILGSDNSKELVILSEVHERIGYLASILAKYEIEKSEYM